VKAGDRNANLYWSCPAGLTNDWRDKLGEWQKSSAVPWLSIEAQEGSLRLMDDEGQQVALGFSRSRPNGVIACSSGPKLLLGVLRIGQLLGFSLANESMEKIVLNEGISGMAFGVFEMSNDIIEEMAFAIGLLQRAFRLRHLAVPISAIPAEELFF
jgi:hypothetical protein